MRLLLLALAACGSPAGPPPPTQPNFLVIDIDSMSAGDPWLSGEGGPLAPGLVALAERGAAFPRMQSAGGWTVPALVGLLTGAWPPMPGPQGSELTVLPPEHPLLPDLLEVQGYHSVAFWGRTAPSEFALLRDAFDESHVATTGEAPVGELRAWLARGPQEPFFCLLHQIDLYRPYPTPPAGWVQTAEPCLPACALRPERPEALLWDLQDALGAERALAHFEAHRRAALTWYDDQISTFLADFEASGLSGRTVVLVLSDHGNDLMAHGVLGHSVPFQGVLQVPLILIDPALPEPGLRRDERVRSVDLAPTLLARAGLPLPAGLAGQSLLPLLGLAPGAWAPAPAFSLSNPAAAALLDGDLKLLRWRPFHDRERRERLTEARPSAVALYDLAADPGETRDLSSELPEEAAAFVERLDTWLAERRAEGGLGRAEPLSPVLREALRERGYWSPPAPEDAVPD